MTLDLGSAQRSAMPHVKQTPTLCYGMRSSDSATYRIILERGF